MWNEFKNSLREYLMDPERWALIAAAAVKIALIYIAGKIVKNIARKSLSHMMAARERSPLNKFDHRRTKTIGKLLDNTVAYTVNFIVIILILNQLGFELMPLLAGASVVGLAVGFGAQNLVKDVISGFFIIFEDQFAVGDVIQTGNFKGTVEQIGLRTTRIRSWTGEVHIIPNGSITQVTNFSLNNSLAVLDVQIAYEADLEKAARVLEETVARLHEHHDEIVKKPEVLGVQSFSQTETTIRIVAECRPNTQAEVTRLMNAEIKKALDEYGLKRSG